MDNEVEQMVAVRRDLLEKIARIHGPASFAALALLDADSHDGPVRFWSTGPKLVVEKLPKEA